MLKVEIIKLAGSKFSDLADRWRILEADSNGSFFQSSLWVGSWFDRVINNADLYLMEIKNGNIIVALGILGRFHQKRHYILKSKTMSLFETGNKKFDTLTVEHNGLLIKNGWEEEAWGAAMEKFMNIKGLWEEIRVSGVSNRKVCEYLESAEKTLGGFKVISELAKPYYWVNLNEISDGGEDYLSFLSSNTRYQIRRAIKLYRIEGEIEIRQADSIKMAMKYFKELSGLHQKYWNNKGQKGAFSTKFTKEFHESLITRGFPKNNIQLLSVRTNKGQIGYLYNFIYRDRVMNYQSGFVYDKGPKYKPGLVCHALAIQKCAKEGFGVYDFLMGDMQYKRSLSNCKEEMYWLNIQSYKYKFALEKAAKRVKESLKDKK